jgi:hypothetical protein
LEPTVYEALYALESVGQDRGKKRPPLLGTAHRSSNMEVLYFNDLDIEVPSSERNNTLNLFLGD